MSVWEGFEILRCRACVCVCVRLRVLGRGGFQGFWAWGGSGFACSGLGQFVSSGFVNLVV